MTTPPRTPLTDDLVEAAGTSASQGLSCRRYRVGQCTVVAVTGDIDESSAPAFRHELEEAAAEHAGDRIIVDLAGVTFLGCSGIGELVQAVRRAHWSPGSLCLTGASESVRKVLDVMHVDTVCPIYESLELAVEASR